MWGTATVLESGPNKLTFFGGMPKKGTEGSFLLLSYHVPESMEVDDIKEPGKLVKPSEDPTKPPSDELLTGILINEDGLTIQRDPSMGHSQMMMGSVASIKFNKENEIIIEYGESKIEILEHEIKMDSPVINIGSGTSAVFINGTLQTGN